MTPTVVRPTGTPAEPFSLTIDQTAAHFGVSRTRIYAMTVAGLLTPRRAGKRTLILTAEMRAVIEALPPAPIRRRKDAA